MRSPGRVGSFVDRTGINAPKLASFAYMDAYDADMEKNNRDTYNSMDESDEEFKRALALSKREF